METLRYSTRSIILQCLMIFVIAGFIGAYFFVPRHHGPAPYLRMGPVWTSVALMVVAYGAVVQAVRTWMSLGNDRVALTLRPQGIDFHTVWTRRSFAWSEIRSVALERRSTRNGHYYVVALHSSRGLRKCFSVRTRMLEGSLDAIGAWADKAEAQLLQLGGQPIAPPTGWLSARLWKQNQYRIARARQRSVQ